jgi:hypothetical protein
MYDSSDAACATVKYTASSYGIVENPSPRLMIARVINGGKPVRYD